MPTSPATSTLASAIQTIMQGATVNGSPAYANVIIGGLKDYTDSMPVGVVLITKGSSERYTLGRSAKIHDKPKFVIASVVPYTNAEAAEQQLFAIRDAVTFLFQQSATLNTPGVILSGPLQDSERWSFPTINGNKCRACEFTLAVTFEYTLPLGPQP
jgi:hypothetical protein